MVCGDLLDGIVLELRMLLHTFVSHNMVEIKPYHVHIAKDYGQKIACYPMSQGMHPTPN